MNKSEAQPASCNGACGRVVPFPSRKKLFQHLREKHDVGGFSRRGRLSKRARQDKRAELHAKPGATQPRRRPVPAELGGPTEQPQQADTHGFSSREAYEAALAADAHGFSSQAAYQAAFAAGVHSRASASPADAQGQSPAMGVTSPAKASDRLQGRQFACEGVDSSPATGVSSPAKASPAPAKASASAHAPPPRSCLGSPATGVTSPAEASPSLGRASSSPAMATPADGDLPCGPWPRVLPGGLKLRKCAACGGCFPRANCYTQHGEYRCKCAFGLPPPNASGPPP